MTSVFAGSHSAGVTVIRCHPTLPHVIATGSYDETVNLWDLRRLPPLSPCPAGQNGKRQRYAPLASVRVGGGVWRLRWHPTDPHLLLAAVMHGGVRALLVSSTPGDGAASTTTMQVVEAFHQHDSMAYGLDWAAPFAAGENVVASCSFYDCKLNVWASQAPAEIRTSAEC